MGNNRLLRNSFVYLLIIIGVIVIFWTLLPSFGGRDERPLSTVLSMAEDNQIAEIVADGKKLTVIPRSSGGASPNIFTSRLGDKTDIMELLVAKGIEIGTPGGVQVRFKGSSGLGSFLRVMITSCP